MQTAVVLSANERVALRAIALQVGALSETISVTAEAARVQTQSSERSGLITQEQLKEVTLKGRDYMGMLKLLPGVVDTANREAPGWNNIGGLAINGGRNNTINLTYDGVTNLDTGSNTGPFLAPGLDSIAEIKVLTSNYQAEYGRSSGGTINVITKSGSRDLHGGGFYSKRSERFNANEWQNNKTGAPKPPYQFDIRRLQRRGPHRAARSSTASRNKLFFFWNQEFLPRTDPGTLQLRNVPTELERRGDFSRSFDNNGNLIVIRDPIDGTAVPEQHHSGGSDRSEWAGAAERLSGAERRRPAAAVQLHVPELVRPPAQRPGPPRRLERRARTRTFYSRLNFGYEAYKGGWGFVLNNANWPQLPIAYEIHSYGIVNTLLHTFSPTLVAEVTVGLNHGKQTVEPLTQADLERNDRTQVGLASLPQFYPGGEPGAHSPQRELRRRRGWRLAAASAQIASLGVEGRYPFFGQNDIWNSSANLTKVMGAHNMKVGLFYEHTTRPAARSSTFNGSLQLRPQHRQPARYESPVCQRAHRLGQQLLGIHAAPRRRRALHEHRVVRSGQLAREEELHGRCGPALLSHWTDDQQGRSAGRVPAGSIQRQPGAAVDSADQHGERSSWCQPGHRRNPAGGKNRHVRAELRQSRRMASRYSTRGCSTRHPSRWRRASGSRGM